MPVMPCKSLFGRLSCGMGGGWRAALVGRAFRGTALHMGKGAGNSGAPRTRPRGAGCRGGSIPGFTCRRRTGRGCAAQFCLTPQMGAGDGPGQEAQPHPHRLSLLHRVNRRIGNGVGDSSAGPVPVGFVFVVSHLFPPRIAGVNGPPDPYSAVQCGGAQSRTGTPYRVCDVTPRW